MNAPVRHLHLDISSHCNQDCPICYYPEAAPQNELSVSDAERIAKEYTGCAVILGGREPTMRNELPQIIERIRPHCSILLLTNGLRLGEPGYLASLQGAGLDGVILSLNGLDDNTLTAMGGTPCFKQKMAAFHALKAAGIPTIISMTVDKAINSSQVAPMLHLCQENTDFVREFRLRAVRSLGKHTPAEHTLLHMPELLSLITNSLGTKPEHIERGARFWKKMGTVFTIDAYRPLACTREVMLRRVNGTWHAEGALITSAAESALSNWKQRWWLRGWYVLALLHQMARIHGWIPVLRRFKDLEGRILRCTLPSHRARLQAIQGQDHLLQITLKSWPTQDNYPDAEQRKCPTLFVSSTERTPFCVRNLKTGANLSK